MAQKSGSVIAIIGPTGIGKTKLSIALALAHGGEVVSVDSLQCYRDGKIMTAQATAEEIKGVKHYMIDYLGPAEEPVGFLGQAIQAVRKIHSRGKVAILCGGSTSLTEPLLFEPSILACRPLVITLFADSEVLNNLTDTRIDSMISDGLLEEVRGLHEKRELLGPAGEKLTGIWKSIGYPELAPYLSASNGSERTRLLMEAVAEMKLNTRKYSSMQQNWIWTYLLHRVYQQGLHTFQLRVQSKRTFQVDVEEKALELSTRWLKVTRTQGYLWQQSPMSATGMNRTAQLSAF